jgi:hypothetical protein
MCTWYFLQCTEAIYMGIVEITPPFSSSNDEVEKNNMR